MKKFIALVTLIAIVSTLTLTSCLHDLHRLADVEDIDITYLGENNEGGWYFIDEGGGYGTLLLMKEGVPALAGECSDAFEGLCEQHDEGVLVFIVGGMEYAPYVDENGIGLDPMPLH